MEQTVGSKGREKIESEETKKRQPKQKYFNEEEGSWRRFWKAGRQSYRKEGENAEEADSQQGFHGVGWAFQGYSWIYIVFADEDQSYADYG